MVRLDIVAALLVFGTLHSSLPAPVARAAGVSPATAGGFASERASPAVRSASPAFTGCGGTLGPAVNAAFEQQVIALINAQRAAQPTPLPPLTLNPGLAYAARYHAADMAHDGYFQHDTYDLVNGVPIPVCAWSERVARYYSGAAMLGENIAAGYATPAGVVSGWMASPDHRANILSSSYSETGVGYYSGGPMAAYWVQDFGRGGKDHLFHQFLPHVLNGH